MLSPPGSGLNLREHPVGILGLKGSVQPALPGNSEGLVSTIFAQIFDKRGVVNRTGFVNPLKAVVFGFIRIIYTHNCFQLIPSSR